MENKIEKLKKILEISSRDTISAKEIEQFLVLVLNTIKSEKDSFKDISDEQIKKIEESISFIETRKEELSKLVENKTKDVKSLFLNELNEAKKLLKEISKIKATPGRDGKDGKSIKGENGRDGKDGKDGESIKGKDGKDGSPDTPDEVTNKVNLGKPLIKKERIEGLADIENNLKHSLYTGISETRALELIRDNTSTSSGGTVGHGTINELAYFDTTTSIASLPVATYPSLTEISYVKGLSSALQTQLNGKQATLVSATNIKTINGASILGAGDLTVSAAPAGSSKAFQYNNSSAFAGSSNLTQETNQILVTASSTSVIPLVVQSLSSSQTSKLFEVQRYDGGAGLSVDFDTSVTIGGPYDYVNAKHAAGHTIRYANGGYTGGLLLQNISSGSAVRFNTVSNSLYITDSAGAATPLILGVWANPGDGTTFTASTGRWHISAGWLAVNYPAQGIAQIEATTTSIPQFGGFYDTSNYFTIGSGSTGNVTLNAVGSSPSFNFSDAVNINGLLTLSAQNIATDTTTGMKIGTTTTQKLGFWNKAPVVQPTTAITAGTFVANTSLIFDDSATFDGYTIGQIVASLRLAGLLA